MASRSPSPSKRGRREDDDDESRRRKKLEKGKEPTAKDVDEEPLFDDNKFAAELLRSAFRKLQGVGEAFDIKAHHDVYKDPNLKGLALRIHRLAEKLKNLPVVKKAARRHFFFDDGGSDSDDGSHGNDSSDDGSHNNVCVLLCLRLVLGHELLS
jgi:ribosomal protein S8E